MRLNPRQRWNGDGTSVVAGVPLCMWQSMIAWADEQIAVPIKRTGHEEGRYRADDNAYKSKLTSFSNDMKSALAELIETKTQDWIKRSRLKLRAGRGEFGSDMEITVVSRRYDDMRSYLTNASLGLTDEKARNNPEARYSKGTPWQELIYRLLQTLDESSDRRPFNRYTYKDMSLTVIGKLGVSRRLERAKGDVKFQQMMRKMFNDNKRTSRVGVLDWKVQQQQKEAA